MTAFKQPPFILLILLILSVLFPPSLQAQQIIRDVRVEGTQRIDPSTVKSYLDLKTGDPMT